MTSWLDDEVERGARYRDLVHNLWGIGFTVVPRARGAKAYDQVDGLAPHGMAYQWHDKPEVKGWETVLTSRHPGLFAPYGVQEPIERHGLYLLERPKVEVEAALAESRAKVKKNIDDWADKAAGQGFVGSFKVGGEETKVGKTVGDPALTKFPAEMLSHFSEVMRERDKLVQQCLKATIEIPQKDLQAFHLTSLRASCLQIAIDVVRQRHEQKGTDNGAELIGSVEATQAADEPGDAGCNTEGGSTAGTSPEAEGNT